jgi:Restriction endonuclease S subunits
MTHPTAMPKDSKPALTPKLRFPEFQHAPAWQEKSLGSLGKFTRGLTYSTDDVTTQGLPVLRSTNIQDGTLVLDRDLVFVSKTCPGSLRLQKGDIVICMSNGSKALVGKSAEYFGDYPGDITVGAFCSFFRPELPFSKIAFQTSDYARYVGVLIAGGNINNLNNSVLEEFRFPIPPSSAEQQKIAECLSTLDELIGAESQKLDALKTHKKGLMQQLFPREGETRPRLRFPEFRDAPEWEQRRLGDLVEIATGQVDPKEPPYCDLPQIGSENIESNTGKIVNVKTAREKGVISGNYVFDKEDVLYSKIRPALNKVAAPSFKGVCSADIYPVRPNSGSLLRNYLVFLLLSEKFLGYAIRSSDRGKIPKINREALLSYEAHVPSVDEQRRIADCLSSLDDLIAAQSEKLESLRTHKRGLMQQLFPNPSEFES